MTQVFAAVKFPGVGDMGDTCPERHELRYPREVASVLRSGRGSGLGVGTGYRPLHCAWGVGEGTGIPGRGERGKLCDSKNVV